MHVIIFAVLLIINDRFLTGLRFVPCAVWQRYNIKFEVSSQKIGSFGSARVCYFGKFVTIFDEDLSV